MGGFDFSNYNRNVALHSQGVPLPKATSTGTTIVGCIFDGGVVIAADTRATQGPIVADKVRWRPLRELSTVQFKLIKTWTLRRTARSYITLLLKYGALAQERLQILSSLLHSSPPTSNSTLYPLAASQEL